MTRQYITTAIDYPNAAPHMGHVLEKVLADVCARWFRLRGDDVRFQIGTDEHGIKIQQTAKKEDITPKELVDRNVPLFQNLYKQLNISADYFIRTSNQKVHWPTVIELWKKLKANGALEKRTYVGLYCSGCERFITKKELVDGKCPDHNRAPEEVKEENWFFLLKREEKWLKDLLTTAKDGTRIVPQFRENETLSLIEQGLEDVSFSRPTSSLSWGVPVPDDEGQTMYVWCDALTNYISGLDYFNSSSELKKYWDNAEVTHVIGKDIARFHALYWPAMLKEAGIKKMPDRLLMHGFLTSEGQKMSKSIGNVVVPTDVLAKFNGNPDPIRFFLSHEIPVGQDGDFSWKRLEEIYIGVLSNKIGNLLNRALILLKKEDASFVIPEDVEMVGYIADFWKKYSKEMDEFDLFNAVGDIVAFATSGNIDMEKKKPWTLSGNEKIAILGNIIEKLRHISLMLLPFMPVTAQKISKQLNVPYADEMLDPNFKLKDETKDLTSWGGIKGWTKVGQPEILFPPLES